MIQNGESVAITSRRKVVANLVPPPVPKRSRRSRPWANIDVRLAELQKLPMLAVSGAEQLAQDRDRY